MKKFLFFAALFCVISSFNAMAQTWAVVGGYSVPAWNFEASTVLKPEGDVYVCEIDRLYTEFKIVDISNDNWDTEFGTSTPIEINTTYKLDRKNGDFKPANIIFDKAEAVDHAKIIWNPSEATLRVEASREDLYFYPLLYMTGTFKGCNWQSPSDAATIRGVEKDGIYTFTVNLGDNPSEFKLATQDWGIEIAAKNNDNNMGYSPVSVSIGGSNMKTDLTGEQTLIFNYNNMKLTFGDAQYVSETTWVVPGAYGASGWNLDNSVVLEDQGNNEYSAEINDFCGYFKIVAEKDWDLQYGTSQFIHINRSYTLDAKNGGNDTNDIIFGTVDTLKDAFVTWQPAHRLLTVTADYDNLSYHDLYLTGSFCNWAAPAVLSRADNGTVLMNSPAGNGNYAYTAEVDLGNEPYNEFKIVNKDNKVVVSGGATINNNIMPVTMGDGENLSTNLTGSQTLTFNPHSMLMTFNNSDGVITGVEGVAVDNEISTEVVYYNLQGVQVHNPSTGIYIKKEGDKISKIILH